MPPPRGTFNPLEGPADYDMTSVVHNDSYPGIDPSKTDLTGKAVFISGASRGLGRAMSISFAKAGVSMLALGARSDVSETVKAAQEAAAQAGRAEPKILSLKFDVSDRKGVDEAAQTVREQFGRLDILVNNAGLLLTGFIADSDPDDWMRVWSVNLMGPYLLTRAFIPLMLERGDKTIVTVSSVGAHCQMPGLSAYQMSKLAVLRLAEFVCAEYGDKGILAYSVHPGNVQTDMADGVVSPELAPVFVETPELSADSLVYLTSEKRDWLAGRYLNVTWDLPELMRKKDSIVSGDKLKVRLVV
ncbi:hypothetical protein JX265_012805 [Neoarthrinium moseri]|uniref:Uncharacterized protein n=1 Tax=Neoarthrinium moseri TaxID=1658444 RepID=A0A9P9W9L0_9PEZI|nr:hypothetical protein JX266_005132 [Neoarthrinium moseri]KAI1853049.1 hypothetical protein JX265_012805 [Neoarthrinium moseri]